MKYYWFFVDKIIRFDFLIVLILLQNKQFNQL